MTSLSGQSKFRHVLIAVSVFTILTVLPSAVSSQPESKKVLWVDVKDFISSATSEHVASAVERASASNHSAIVLALDTPGGSVDATLNIITSMQQSDVPIIGYVYPSGKSAWSAGTIILMASDYAAMAPVTTIGSAQPVVGGVPVDDTKIVNALTEKVVSLAELHGRNATQAARFITHNDNLTPENALRQNVIEAIASSPENLLQKAHNATVMTIKGPKVLDTLGAEIVRHEPSLRVTLVSILANPLLATTFLTVGFFALIYGLASPGFGGEIAGATLIILSLAGQGFDINWAAFALLAIGVGLVAYELYTPGFGAIGIGGIIVLSIGSSLMITQPVEPVLTTEQHLGNLALLSTLTTVPFGAFFGFLTYKAWQAKKKRPVQFAYQSEEGTALDPIAGGKPGFVFVGGEYWKARSVGQDINKGQKVKIVGKQDGMLLVEPLQDKNGQSSQ